MKYQDNSKVELLKESHKLQQEQNRVKDLSNKNARGSGDFNLGRRSAWVLLTSIFVGEIFIMLLVNIVQIKLFWIEILVNSSLLSILIIPAIYFFVVRPITNQANSRNQVEESLKNTLSLTESTPFEAKLKSLVTRHDSIEISYKWNGPQLINLLDTTITLGNFALMPGFYDEIELKVNGAKLDAGANPVFYLHGVYTKADITTIPVKVIVNENVSFKSEKDSVAVTATDNADFASVIQLYLDQLMTEIQPSALDNATLTDGILVISADKNKELYRIIMRNLGKNHHSRHSHKDGHGMGH